MDRVPGHGGGGIEIVDGGDNRVVADGQLPGSVVLQFDPDGRTDVALKAVSKGQGSGDGGVILPDGQRQITTAGEHRDAAGGVDVAERVADDPVANHRCCQRRIDTGDPYRVGTGEDPVDGVVLDCAQVDGGRVGRRKNAPTGCVVERVVLDLPEGHGTRVGRIDRDRIRTGPGHRVVGNRREGDRTSPQRPAVR